MSIHPKDNRSLSIKQGYSGYLDFSTGDKGNSVDFLVKYMDYQLDDAVFALCDEAHMPEPKHQVQNTQVSKLPPAFPVPI